MWWKYVLMHENGKMRPVSQAPVIILATQEAEIRRIAV
jgi:hypothetical protein